MKNKESKQTDKVFIVFDADDDPILVSTDPEDAEDNRPSEGYICVYKFESRVKITFEPIVTEVK